ncbi:SirB2 family protein [Gammaproteobacteria bacterium]|nr:SirB2 family protein [Gammaproteobacteria bacterium]
MNAFLIAYTIHIAAVCLSGSFFLVRGIWMIQENTLLEKKIVRIAPHIIDTVLLTAGVMLSVLVQQYPGIDSWLTVKILALIAYIVLGVFALKRGKTKTARLIYLAAAIAAFGFMVSVSLARSPLGFLAYF